MCAPFALVVMARPLFEKAARASLRSTSEPGERSVPRENAGLWADLIAVPPISLRFDGMLTFRRDASGPGLSGSAGGCGITRSMRRGARAAVVSDAERCWSWSQA
jgi:hypothetical protein